MNNPIAHLNTQERKAWVEAKLLEKRTDALRLYFDEGIADREVARQMNYSLSSIRLWIREEERLNPQRRANRVSKNYDPRKMENRKPVSAIHAKLGVLIARYMGMHRMKNVEFGLVTGLTSQQVSEALTGSYDFKLSELQSIMDLINLEPTTLFQGMHNGPIRATPVDRYRFAPSVPDNSEVQRLQTGPEQGVPDGHPASSGTGSNDADH